MTLTSTTYDGTVIETEELEDRKHGPQPRKTAATHRWAVRAHLYLTRTNRLPHAADWQEIERVSQR